MRNAIREVKKGSVNYYIIWYEYSIKDDRKLKLPEARRINLKSSIGEKYLKSPGIYS